MTLKALYNVIFHVQPWQLEINSECWLKVSTFPGISIEVLGDYGLDSQKQLRTMYIPTVEMYKIYRNALGHQITHIVYFTSILIAFRNKKKQLSFFIVKGDYI